MTTYPFVLPTTHIKPRTTRTRRAFHFEVILNRCCSMVVSGWDLVGEILLAVFAQVLR
jgi:hypothetical protein